MNRFSRNLGIVAVGLVAGVVAQAQTATTGSITGMVRDAKGAPLAGATVTASSAQIVRTTTTGDDGTYRLSLLNAGTWNLKVAKAGQTAPTQKITVLVNNAQVANFKVAAEASSVVVVVATAASMDLTTNQVGSVMQMESMDSIPTQRDFNQLVMLAPGTVSGGTMGGTSIAGASAIENNFVIDGLDTTDYRLGFQGATMPTDFIDQVEVQTGGFRPEFSALGGVVNAITKSGTNKFVGSAWITSDMAQLSAKPESNAYYTQVASKNLLVTVPEYRYDFGFTAGGALIPDKLFYFVGFNEINAQSIPTTNLSNLTNSPTNDKTTNVYAKVNYYLSQSQQLTGTLQYTKDPISQDHLYPASLGNRDFGYSQTNNVTNWSLNYDWTINPALLLSLKYGASVSDSHTTPTSTAPSITDYLWYYTGPGNNDPNYGFNGPNHVPYATHTFIHGGSGDWNNTNDSNNQQFRADLSYFVNNHSLKFGLSHNTATAQTIDYLNADDRVTISASHITVTQYANEGSKATLAYDAFYAQDQWEITPGFRLSYGFREEYQTVKGNRDQTIFKFNNFTDQLQPRVGLTWDLNNDGKTKLSANFAIYNERFPMQAALRTGGNETYKQYTFYFPASGHATHLDPNATYDPATGNFAHSPISSAYLAADYSGFFRDDPQPQGVYALKVPKREEVLLGVDHTYDSGWSMGAHAKWRSLLRIIEDTVPTDANGVPIDGQGYSILWNPGYGKTYTWANNQYFPVGGNGAGTGPGTLNTWKNTVFPNPKNVYESLDVTIDKKSDRYTLSASFTWSKIYGNYEGVGQTSNGQSDANITSTWDYAPYVGNGPLPTDHTWNCKVYGSYTWDVLGGRFTMGGSGTLLTGAPRTIFDDGSLTLAANPGATHLTIPGAGAISTANGLDWGGYGNATPLNFEYGNAGREATQYLINMHLDYSYKINKRFEVKPSFDIFNLCNTRTGTQHDDYATTQADAPNVAFGQINQWLAGRSYRWGVKVAF